MLYDLGPHTLSLVLALAGSAPVAVSAQLRSTRDDGADDDAEVYGAVRLRVGRRRVGLVTAEQVVWDLQAASDTGVLRLELLPEVRVEHDGEPVTVPAARHEVPDPRLEQFG